MTGPVRGLGYLGMQASDLDQWRRFGTGLLGLQVAEDSRDRLAFRMDAAAARLFLAAGHHDAAEFFGWSVDDAAALDALAAALDAAGFPVSPMSAGLAARRGVAGGLVTTDPGGHRVELFWGQTQAPGPFVPGRPLSGFRTGALGMGHLVLKVERIEAMLPFYQTLLGFRLSDYTLAPFKAYFFHSNARHHSLALIESPERGVHHLMLEVRSLDDVGQGYDLAQLESGRVAATLGRHANDHMMSFYLRTPSPFFVEYGWGGRDIDPACWTPHEIKAGPSLWGHERDWVSDTVRAEARRLRLAAAARGERAPVRIPPEGE